MPPFVYLVAHGEALLAPAVIRLVIEEFVRREQAPLRSPPAALQQLTPREREVFDLLV